MEKTNSGACINKLQMKPLHKERAGKTRRKHALSRPMIRNGVQRISLPALRDARARASQYKLSSHRVLNLIFEKLLHYLKLATSSSTKAKLLDGLGQISVE